MFIRLWFTKELACAIAAAGDKRRKSQPCSIAVAVFLAAAPVLQSTNTRGSEDNVLTGQPLFLHTEKYSGRVIPLNPYSIKPPDRSASLCVE